MKVLAKMEQRAIFMVQLRAISMVQKQTTAKTGTKKIQILGGSAARTYRPTKWCRRSSKRIVGVCLVPEARGSRKTREGGELSINSQVVLGLGEVTKIEPLRQCLLNCINAYTQEAEMETYKKRRSRAEQIKRQGN